MQRKKSNSSKKNIPITVEFTKKNLTSWGGIAGIISHYFECLDFRNWVDINIPVDDVSNNIDFPKRQALQPGFGIRFAALDYQNGFLRMQEILPLKLFIGIK